MNIRTIIITVTAINIRKMIRVQEIGDIDLVIRDYGDCQLLIPFASLRAMGIVIKRYKHMSLVEL